MKARARLAPSAAPPQPPTPCDPISGKAGIYPCKNIDFLAHISLDQFTGQHGAASDIWGWVDLNDQHEYAIIGLQNGTAVVDVTDPQNPSEISMIPGKSATWRDIKVYQFFDNQANRWKAYAYVTVDKPDEPQALQIIDLTGITNECFPGC